MNLQPRVLMHWLVVAIALLLAMGNVDAANIFKCKAKDGTVTVSNTPCAKGSEPDAKLSGAASKSTITPYRSPCERVAEIGVGLMQIRGKLSPVQLRAVDAEDFGRMNSAGASRILAEYRDDGTLRVCAFFNGGDTIETVIEAGGLVRRDGVVDSDDPAVRASNMPRDGLSMCTQRIDTCRSSQSALDFSFEKCMRAIPMCSNDITTECCPQACFTAYWKPPYEYAAGLAAMKATPACRDARGIRR